MTDPNSQLGFDPWELSTLSRNPRPPTLQKFGSSADSGEGLHEPCHYDDSLIFVGYALISVGLALAGIAVGFLLLGWLA